MDLNIGENHTIDFGLVKYGTTHVKTFSDPHFVQIREVSQWMDSCNIDSCFQVSIDEADPSSVNVKFSPKRPSMNHCTYFKLVNKAMQMYNLCLKAATEELEVITSRRCIEIVATAIGKAKITWFDLINVSKSVATFQFKFDEAQSDIKLKPRFGQIGPGETIKTILTFTPTGRGTHYRIIQCFIQHHAPLMITVQAICQKPPKYERVNHRFSFIETVPQPNNSFKYLFDQTTTMGLVEVKPPVILDRKYVDLGSKTLSSGDNPAMATITAINQSPVNILIDWQPDRFGVFEVTPSSSVVQERSKVKFAVTFNPTLNDNFFSAVVVGALRWGDAFVFVVPYHLSLNLVGNSFETDKFGWLAEYTLPTKVIIPPNIPGQKAWATFMIRRRGHLPLMFRILPVEKSRFKFEPELGVITEDFQIIHIEYDGGMIASTTHREKRKILLNTSKYIDLEIIGTSENPNLWFTKGDKVVFPPTPSNCTLESYVQVKNITRHLLRFNFETLSDDLVRAKMNRNVILPGEQTKLWLSFSPNALGPYKSNRYLHISCQDLNTRKTFDNKHLISFNGSSVLPKLTCIPENLSLGSVHRDETITNYFVVSNIGECTCFIKFRVVPKECLSVYREFTFEPECITLNPTEDLKVHCTVAVDTFGFQSYEVLAILCQTSSFKTDQEVYGIHLANVHLFCHSYKFRIDDIINLNGEEATTPKYHLWNIFNIDGWNNKLNKCSTFFTDELVEMKVPEWEVSTKVLRVSMIFENMSDVQCTLNITKTTPCDCPPYTTKTGFILERPDILCPHRSQIQFSPSTEYFKPKEKKSITILVRYNNPTVVRSTFQLVIFCTSHPTVKHQITLIITRYNIGADEHSADICHYDGCYNSSSFSLKNIFVGTPNPPLQAIWFYNNSSKDVNYSMTLKGIQEDYLKCVNPTGQIPQHSHHPVFFKFAPLRPIEYKAKLVCKLGEKERLVLIKGNGILHHSRNPLLLDTTMPFISTRTQHIGSAYVTPNHLVIDNLATHSIAKRIFQLKNQSSVDLNFMWAQFTKNNLVSLTAMPEKGVLKPNQEITINMTAKSFSEPFILVPTLTCALYHEETSGKYSRSSKKRLSIMSKRTYISIKEEYYNSMIASSKTKYTPSDLKPEIPECLTVTVAINCCDIKWMEKLPLGQKRIRESWKLPTPLKPCFQEWNLPPINTTLSFTLSQLFNHIILNTLESQQFHSCISEHEDPKYFSDIEAASENEKIPYTSSTTPQILIGIIEEALLKSFSKLLQPENRLIAN